MVARHNFKWVEIFILLFRTSWVDLIDIGNALHQCKGLITELIDTYCFCQLEQVQLGSDQQRVNLQKSLAEAEARERRVQEQAEHKVSDMC